MQGRRAVVVVAGVLVVGLGWGAPLGLPVVAEVWAQAEQSATRTIIADLLMIDGDFYIVRTEYGEVQIEATHKTKITEEFEFGDRIKAIVLSNDKALVIERAGPDDIPGVTENQPTPTAEPVAKVPGGTSQPAKGQEVKPQPVQPKTKTVIADLLMVDGDFYVFRGEYGEFRIEVTQKTKITEEFEFGDRIKAIVLMNDKALTIERAGPNDVPGVTVHTATLAPAPKGKDAKAPMAQEPGATAPPPGGKSQAAKVAQPGTRVVEGDILMIDGDFYVLRGELGEIRVEKTEKTKITEEFQFGDRIKATVLKNDKALSIERAK